MSVKVNCLCLLEQVSGCIGLNRSRDDFVLVLWVLIPNAAPHASLRFSMNVRKRILCTKFQGLSFHLHDAFGALQLQFFVYRNPPEEGGATVSNSPIRSIRRAPELLYMFSTSYLSCVFKAQDQSDSLNALKTTHQPTKRKLF
jgi:hypothetical protein